MELHISLEGPGDRTARIYRQLLDAVLDGRLRPGERLPPSRELARTLGVARNTVAVAYERLTAEGVLTARVGSGTYVAAEPLTPPRTRTRPPHRAAPRGGVRPRRVWETLAPTEAGGPPPYAASDADHRPAPRPASASEPHPHSGPAPDRPPTSAPPPPPPAYDFRVGAPDPALFPLATWRRLVTAELRAATLLLPGYADPAGHPALRTAVARYAGVSRSVRARAADVLVTQGAQQALDLVGRVLIEPGDRVAVEEPGYPPARRLFRSLGARVTGVPVDAEGLVVEALPPAARLVYVTPSHQFPLGTPMSLARRAALLAWAARRGAVVVEDDYDTEFRFSDRPLEPLQSLDREGRVVYVGTFSKTLLPRLRLGFLVAPASLQPALHAARQLADWHGDVASQAALARFIDSGELPRHIRKATKVYAARRARVLDALHGPLARWLDPVPSAAGLHVSARLRPGTDTDVDDALRRARTAGVAAESLAAYCADAPRPGVVLGYGSVREESVDEGLRRLAEAFDG